jgi:hypothetical protein
VKHKKKITTIKRWLPLTYEKFIKAVPKGHPYAEIFTDARSGNSLKHRAFAYYDFKKKTWYVIDPYTRTKCWHIPLSKYLTGIEGDKDREKRIMRRVNFYPSNSPSHMETVVNTTS